jgi:RNA polymerase-binding transcription factor DksA
MGTDSSDVDLPPEAAAEQIDALGAALDGVERSLGRIDAGRYGQCDECGSSIDDALLLGDPTASLCAACPPPAPG